MSAFIIFRQGAIEEETQAALPNTSLCFTTAYSAMSPPMEEPAMAVASRWVQVRKERSIIGFTSLMIHCIMSSP